MEQLRKCNGILLYIVPSHFWFYRDVKVYSPKEKYSYTSIIALRVATGVFCYA